MGGFDVVITGFKLNGKESAAKVLERVLGEQPDSARSLTKSFPSVVRRALSPAEADSIVMALRGAGARVEVRAAGAPLVAQAAPSAPSASAVAGLIAAQPSRASVPAPGAQSMQLGGLRIDTPREAKKSTGKFILGTLKILLNGPPPPPPQAPAVVIKPAPAPAFSAEAALHATGMRDEAFDDVGTQQPLELDSAALDGRSNQVTGGRKGQVSRPSLMNIVVQQLADVPMRVVRRAKPKEEVVDEEGLVASVETRHPYVWHAFIGVGLLLCIGLSLAVIYKGRGDEVAVATAHGVPAAPGADPAHPDEATLSEEVVADEVGLNPLLKLAPKPMEPALAGILRKQVAGASSVRIDWGEEGPPKDASVSCMVVAGNSVQQTERVNKLLSTGKRYPLTPLLDRQLRDHMEVMRLADGDSKARYTPLCIAN